MVNTLNRGEMIREDGRMTGWQWEVCSKGQVDVGMKSGKV